MHAGSPPKVESKVKHSVRKPESPSPKSPGSGRRSRCVRGTVTSPPWAARTGFSMPPIATSASARGLGQGRRGPLGRRHGLRELLGFDVDNEGFGTSLLRSLETHGLDGMKLVISDAHIRAEENHQSPHRRRILAALVRGCASCARAPDFGQVIPKYGRLDHPHRLRPTRRRGPSIPSSRRSPEGSRRCSTTHGLTCSHPPGSPPRTGVKSGQQIPWNK